MWNEMFSYLITKTKNTEAAVSNITKALKKQTKFNRRIGLLAVAGGAYVVWAERVRQDQEDKITELTRRVEELLDNID